MKKTPFVTVNIRKSVYAAHAAVFAISVCVCCIASRNVRPLSMGKGLTNAIISADGCAAIPAGTPVPMLFLREKQNKHENKKTETKAASDAAKQPDVASVQTSVPTAPIHTRTAAASIGEVQVSIWPEEMIEKCRENGIVLL